MATAKDVWALDFDGVVADSVGESSLSAWKMVQHFGKTRDEWMAEDLAGWLGSNAIYPGLPNAIKRLMASAEVYVVTTKQARFTEALLRDMAGIHFPADRIFSQTESGRPKSEVLAMLEARHPDSPRLLFVEDKLATLEKVAARADCGRWLLYLVDWGYNTAEERARAAANPRIEVINLARFASL